MCCRTRLFLRNYKVCLVVYYYHLLAGRSAQRAHIMTTLFDRITINPEISHGKPTIRGLRYPVETILELLSSGMTIEEVLADYEDLEREDILAALAFAARLSQVKRLELVEV